MTVRTALREGEETLTAAGVPDPGLDAGYLLSEVLNVPRMNLLLQATMELSQEQERRYHALLLSRKERIPLQYLLGTQEFYGLTFRTDGRALIPRQETELLCETALEFLKSLRAPRVLDLCTGSGAIAVTLARLRPDAAVFACDLSGDALSLARENAERNAVSVRFSRGDLWEAVRGERFHMIVSNPPYIPRADCAALQPEVLREPLMALDGGEDGLDFYRRIAAGAPEHLEKDGRLLLEIGIGEADAVRGLLTEAGFTDVAVRRDLYGAERVVLGRLEGKHAGL